MSVCTYLQTACFTSCMFAIHHKRVDADILSIGLSSDVEAHLFVFTGSIGICRLPLPTPIRLSDAICIVHERDGFS